MAFDPIVLSYLIDATGPLTLIDRSPGRTVHELKPGEK
jgi:hypothetical protein